MVENKLFENPRIDLSSISFGELYFGFRLEEYASIHPDMVHKATEMARDESYRTDKAGEKLVANITEQVPIEKDTALIVLIGNSHTPQVLVALQNEYNLRYYSPFAEQREFWRKMDIDDYVKGKKYQSSGETPLSHAAKQGILEKVFDDSPDRPYAVVIGDIHGFENEGISSLDSAEVIRKSGVKKMYVTLEGFFKGTHYDVEDIGNQFPLGEYSPFLPQLRKYLESARSAGIDVELVPIEFRKPQSSLGGFGTNVLSYEALLQREDFEPSKLFGKGK